MGYREGNHRRDGPEDHQGDDQYAQDTLLPALSVHSVFLELGLTAHAGLWVGDQLLKYKNFVNERTFPPSE